LAQYLFQVIRFDYSLTVRRHVGRAVSESILMTLAVGEVYMNITPSNPHVTENIELSPEQREQREKERESEQGKIVKAVRKEFNGKPELREIVQSALL
jgi:transcription initiation factor TFIID subunit 2